MIDDRRELVRALAPGRVTYPLGSDAKRFAANMAFIASNPGGTKRITPKQHRYLVALAIKFRRQIPQPIVDLANRLKQEGESDA